MVAMAALGTKFAWAVQVGLASKQFRVLGMSDRHVSIVLLGGPLAGIIVQPAVGTWSDDTGKRRPYLCT